MLNVYKPSAVDGTFNLDFVWNKDQTPPKGLKRFLVNVPNLKFCELENLPTLREDNYFKVKVENKKEGYRISLDKHFRGLVVVEIHNGNYWQDCKSYFDHSVHREQR